VEKVEWRQRTLPKSPLSMMEKEFKRAETISSVAARSRGGQTRLSVDGEPNAETHTLHFPRHAPRWRATLSGYDGGGDKMGFRSIRRAQLDFRPALSITTATIGSLLSRRKNADLDRMKNREQKTSSAAKQQRVVGDRWR
jgi:hypothetical protein